MEFKKFEDTKRVIRSCKSKNERQHKEKGQTTINKTLHRKLKIELQLSTERNFTDLFFNFSTSNYINAQYF